MIVNVKYKYPVIYGFSSIWGKYVDGFNNTKHCEPCLIGTRNYDINKNIATNTDIIIPLREGQVFYICGVTYPYVWKNNFHLVVRGKDGATAEGTTFNNAIFQVKDAEAIYFDDKPAKEKYRHLDYHFTTCRNFQFGVYYFEYLGKTQKPKPQMELFDGA